MKKVITVIIVCVFSMISWNPHTPSPTHAQSADPENFAYLPLIYSDYDPSWQWGNTDIVTLSPSPNSKPLMAIDHNGRVHILWDVSPSSGVAFIYHTQQTDSGWSTPAKIANTLGTSYVLFPPVITPDGLIHLLWYNRLASGGPYRLMYAKYNGNQWSAEEEVARFSSPNRNGILNYDDQGNLQVVYSVSGIISDAYYHRVRTATNWNPAEDITPPIGSRIIFWDIWPDITGGVRFLGQDLDDHIYYSYWKNGGFQTNLQQLPDVTWSDSSVLDTQNNLHLYYVDSVPVPGGNVDGLYHRCLDNSLNWGPEQVLSGQNSVGNNIALAWDNSGRVVFSWKLYDNANFNLSMVTGCNQPISKTGHLTDPSLSIGWDYMDAIALSNQPGKFCALVGIRYQWQNYGLTCADILP